MDQSSFRARRAAQLASHIVHEAGSHLRLSPPHGPEVPLPELKERLEVEFQGNVATYFAIGLVVLQRDLLFIRVTSSSCRRSSMPLNLYPRGARGGCNRGLSVRLIRR